MKKTIVKYGLTLLAGILMGWLFFGGGENGDPEKEGTTEEHVHDEKPTIWTCSMHPQIRQEEPGKCPICGMKLIPADNASSEEAGPNEVVMTESAIQLANIQTTKVKKEIPSKTIYLNGKIKPDETRIYSQTAHVSGRIEKLYVNYTGEYVRKGQKLVSLYSPELISAQKELLELVSREQKNEALLKASRNKLKLWKLTDKQINEIEKSGEIKTEVDILSDFSGFVYMRHVSLGDHAKEGQPLFKIVDMSKVWLMFEAYEKDLPWLQLGDKIEVHLDALPGQHSEHSIKYIDPFINPMTRVANVRVELENHDNRYKLDMFAQGLVESDLKLSEPRIIIPKSAVLWTGKRSIVYIKMPNRKSPSFLMKEIEIGEDAGEFYVVNSGLKVGQKIVVNGVFKVDASAQLSGLPSMMDPEGSGDEMKGHNH